MKKLSLIPLFIFSMLSCNSNDNVADINATTINSTPEQPIENNATTSVASPKNTVKWSTDERMEFLKDCMSSAIETYNTRGETPNEALIKHICACTGEQLETKYTYQAANNLPADSMSSMVKVLATECAKSFPK